MTGLIEYDYNQPVPFVQLPQDIRSGLISLWERTEVTKSEWVAAICSADEPDLYQILILGHQAEGMVTVPIVNISHNARKLGKKFDAEFIYKECVENEWTIRHTSDEEGVCYQGIILYLLPLHVILNHPDLVLLTPPPDNIVLPVEKFLGTAHSHPFRDSLSHLPSLIDTREIVLGTLPIPRFELVVSATDVSLLVKSRQTPHFENDPRRPNYLAGQKLTDSLRLAEGRTHENILEENCRRYYLCLYSGKLNSPEPLLPFFQ